MYVYNIPKVKCHPPPTGGRRPAVTTLRLQLPLECGPKGTLREDQFRVFETRINSLAVRSLGEENLMLVEMDLAITANGSEKEVRYKIGS